MLHKRHIVKSCKLQLPLLCYLFLFFVCFELGIQTASAEQDSPQNSLLEKLKNQSVSVRGEGLSVPIFLRSIGKRAGINIFVAEKVKDTISLDIEEMSLHDLFLFIVDTKKLQYSEKNNMLYVSKNEALPVATEDVCPENSEASELLDQLKPLLSSEGTITISEKSNCFIVQDNEDKIERIKEMMVKLDQPVAQVHIKASIVKASQEAKRQLGITWSADAVAGGSIDKTFDTSPGITPSNLAMTLGYLDMNFDLDITLNALQQDNLALVLSSPQILVMDGKEAEIKQGAEVPFESSDSDGVATTTFKEANLSLKVTPKIQGNLISVELQVNNDTVSSGTSTQWVDTQEISTELVLQDGVTAVIGGIILRTDDNDQDNVPGLSSIPILGHLFKSYKNENKRDELLVFITANIIHFDNAMPITDKTNEYLDENTNIKLISGERMNLTPMELLEEEKDQKAAVPAKQEQNAAE